MIPKGFDVLLLPKAFYLMFQGDSFLEEDFRLAIQTLESAMDKYDPTLMGYRYDNSNPRMRLELIGKRGYIALRAVVKI